MSAPQLQEGKESIYEVLEAIRRHPPMLLGERSSVGWIPSLSATSVVWPLRVSFRAEQPEFQEFYTWIARRLGFSNSTTGWCRMILQKSAGEQDALDRFFILLDEFRKESA